ncbi:hypothetical protein [Prochlorococcus marinus]|uniref:hypothetical protein n=1 Tax=Prochlorococcus marinus TaxID=1219 RepID=UPI0011818BA7|nr:hypothetical protein [Prochlorococcus marinus]
MVVPSIQDVWFIDFIKNSINNPSLDPWSSYLSNYGDSLGFPYGPIMFLIFIPLSFTFWFIGIPFGLEDYFLGIGFRFNLLIFDLISLLVLSKLLNNKKEIIIFYWLSPLIFYVTYIYGQLDIIPTTIVLIGYLKLYKNEFKNSGYFFGLAIATKLSFALIIPFPIIYLWQNKRLSFGFKPFIKSLSEILLVFVLTPVISSGYRQMVLSTPEKASLISFNFSLNDDLKIFILPLIFILIIYSIWRLKRSNFTLLISITGLSFLISTLMMPPSPGWYLWALPFLIIYQIKTDINGKLLISFFTFLPIIIIFPNNIFSKLSFLNSNYKYNTILINSLNADLIYTLFISLGILIAIRLYRESIQSSNYYKLNKRAFVIGISGGPSSGKDILSKSIVDLLGDHSTLVFRERDYFKWNKNLSNTEKHNSINIKSNDLLKLNSDLDLISNKNVLNRKTINNSITKFQSMKSFSKDFIVVNGYHIFLPDVLNKFFNIKIFLDPETELNKNWLKNKNDSQPNPTKISNFKDLKKYQDLYSEQKNCSDIIFSFSYINKEILSYKKVQNLPIKMDVFLKDGIYAENLSKALISICGVKLNSNISNTDFSAKLSIEGDIWPEDIKLAATRLVPNLEEIIDYNAKWQSNILGLMQLIILMQIAYVFKYKIEN